ncbi:MAG: DUF4330 family protein [Ruminococcaceae bacterium]|nr:DUF4330 family protein [Oscillospiraceae bacterium]
MNTQTTKRPFKLNFFDILLIVLAVLIIGAAAALFIYSRNNLEEPRTTIEYTVLVKDLPEEMQIRTEEGQTVLSNIWLNDIGEVVSVDKKNAFYDAFHYEEERTVHAEYDDIYNAAFTFRVDAVKTESSYIIGHVRISVGAEVHFRLPYFVGFGFVTNVREIPAD